METQSKARVVEQFPSISFIKEVVEFKSSLEVTHPVAAEEALEPSPKPKTLSNQADELVSAIKKLGKMKSNRGKLHEPNCFHQEPEETRSIYFPMSALLKLFQLQQ